MIKEVEVSLILPLRSLVLRENKGIEFAQFAEDHLPDVIHMAYMEKEEVVCVASFIPNNLNGFGLGGWQLRGMATHPLHQGKKLGTHLLNHAIELLKSKNAGYLWCNARASALPFYEKAHFEKVSDVFEIENIGPHYKLLKTLN